MDADERNHDLVKEAAWERWAANRRRARWAARDEPPDDDERACPRCGEMRGPDKPDGCEDEECPT